MQGWKKMLVMGFCLQALLAVLPILFERILRKQLFNLEEEIFFPQEAPQNSTCIWTCLELEDSRIPHVYAVIKMISEVIRVHSSITSTFSIVFRKFCWGDPCRSSLHNYSHIFPHIPTRLVVWNIFIFPYIGNE